MLSGARLDSICAQAPSALVAKAANSQASAPPSATSSRALGQQLAKQLSAPRAQRQTQREFTLPRCIASHQQHHYVAQCDQQDKSDHRHQHSAAACRTARRNRESSSHPGGSVPAAVPPAQDCQGRHTPRFEMWIAVAQLPAPWSHREPDAPSIRRHHQVAFSR